MNILFTCAGRRAYLLRYFREQLNGRGLIVGADMSLSAPALTEADVKICVPEVYSPNYIETLLEICRQHEIKAIFSLNDLELPILASNKDKFLNIGCLPVVSDNSVIEICFDKFKTARFIEEIGLKTPKTFVNFEEASHALNNGNLSFPLIVKPRWGSGSIGIECVNSLDELEEAYNAIIKKVKNSILNTASGQSKTVIIQEKINGPEYGLDVMNDLKGRNRGVSVKRKLAMRAGETDKAVTEDNAELRRIGSLLATHLKHIGNLDVDVLERNGEFYVLELNPRFGGGFPFSYEAGVNFPGALIDWFDGRETDDRMLIPKYGCAFAKCDRLVEVEYR